MGVIGAFAAIILVVLCVRESRSAYARWVIVSKATTEEPVEGTINIVDGIYGASCVKIEKSNARESLRRNCNGRASCDYVVNVAIIGDPAPGCSKDFKAEWRCSAQGEVRTLILPPEAGLKSVARLYVSAAGCALICQATKVSAAESQGDADADAHRAGPFPISCTEFYRAAGLPP